MILASNQSESLMNAEVIDRNRLNGVRHSVISLSDYCRKNNSAGYDPYDALNSRLLAHTILLQQNVQDSINPDPQKATDQHSADFTGAQNAEP